MRTKLGTFVAGLVMIVLVMGGAPGGASAAHFYLQHELFEEFEPITETVEAHVESNGVLEWHFPLEVTVGCHAEGLEKLFTNGKDVLTKYRVNTCVSGLCIVAATTFEEAESETVLGESGSPVVYSDNVLGSGTSVEFKLSGAACEHPGKYQFLPLEPCRNTVDNTVELELAFPIVEPKKTSEGCHGSKLATMSGRVRLTPFVGRALKVGP